MLTFCYLHHHHPLLCVCGHFATPSPPPHTHTPQQNECFFTSILPPPPCPARCGPPTAKRTLAFASKSTTHLPTRFNCLTVVYVCQLKPHSHKVCVSQNNTLQCESIFRRNMKRVVLVPREETILFVTSAMNDSLSLFSFFTLPHTLYMLTIAHTHTLTHTYIHYMSHTYYTCTLAHKQTRTHTYS